jgi:hypothetical protein
MISRPDWYAFLIIALFWAVWMTDKLDKILGELKTLREKIDRK